jgi:DNA-directed RNA polymerase sigma subunit (sigma70/sigma32)
VRLGLLDPPPQSYAEAARTLGISVTRVRRIESRALDALRAICPQQASAHL